LAGGIESALFYPTHGYRGLAESLTQPFVFTDGYGGNRALNRYLVQYVGAPDQTLYTYPARTEFARGYPAGLVWHTIYPWLASDLTFLGAVLSMGIVGWAVAAMWIRSVMTRDPVAIGILAYLAILVAFIPANNQIGTSQTNLIGFVTLTVVFMLRPLLAPSSRAPVAGTNRAGSRRGVGRLPGSYSGLPRGR
jgi:hypothetical protein